MKISIEWSFDSDNSTNNIILNFRRGNFVKINGKNGIGKSTSFYIIEKIGDYLINNNKKFINFKRISFQLFDELYEIKFTYVKGGKPTHNFSCRDLKKNSIVKSDKHAEIFNNLVGFSSQIFEKSIRFDEKSYMEKFFVGQGNFSETLTKLNKLVKDCNDAKNKCISCLNYLKKDVGNLNDEICLVESGLIYCDLAEARVVESNLDKKYSLYVGELAILKKDLDNYSKYDESIQDKLVNFCQFLNENKIEYRQYLDDFSRIKLELKQYEKQKKCWQDFDEDEYFKNLEYKKILDDNKFRFKESLDILESFEGWTIFENSDIKEIYLRAINFLNNHTNVAKRQKNSNFDKCLFVFEKDNSNQYFNIEKIVDDVVYLIETNNIHSSNKRKLYDEAFSYYNDHYVQYQKFLEKNFRMEINYKNWKKFSELNFSIEQVEECKLFVEEYKNTQSKFRQDINPPPPISLDDLNKKIFVLNDELASVSSFIAEYDEKRSFVDCNHLINKPEKNLQELNNQIEKCEYEIKINRMDKEKISNNIEDLKKIQVLKVKFENLKSEQKNCDECIIFLDNKCKLYRDSIILIESFMQKVELYFEKLVNCLNDCFREPFPDFQWEKSDNYTIQRVGLEKYKETMLSSSESNVLMIAFKCFFSDYTKKPFIVLDEDWANFDFKTKRCMMRWIKNIYAGRKTILVVDHNSSKEDDEWFDEVVVL